MKTVREVSASADKRELVEAVVREVFPQAQVTISGESDVRITLNQESS